MRSNNGAAAIEFALVAFPLTLLLLGVLQIGFIFIANFNLEGATSSGSRLIRTGQAQTQGFDAVRFKQEVCTNLSAPLTCDGLKLDVRSYPSFSGAASNLTNPLGPDGKLRTDFVFDPGDPEEIVVVRAFFPLEIGTLFPAALGLGRMADGSKLLVATSTFRNEPYQ